MAAEEKGQLFMALDLWRQSLIQEDSAEARRKLGRLAVLLGFYSVAVGAFSTFPELVPWRKLCQLLAQEIPLDQLHFSEPSFKTLLQSCQDRNLKEWDLITADMKDRKNLKDWQLQILDRIRNMIIAEIRHRKPPLVPKEQQIPLDVPASNSDTSAGKCPFGFS